MKVLICGSRHWTSREIIRKELEKFSPDTIVIEGETRGADTIAREEAEKLGFEVLKFPADWKNEGLAAGPKRNSRMLNEGKPDLVIAFHEDWEHSKGTRHMITIAKRTGRSVIIVNDKGVLGEITLSDIGG